MNINNFSEKIKNFQIPFFSKLQVYLDFGTANTRIAIKEKGVVLKEPTVIGLNKRTREYIFFGSEAKKIIGKVPEFIAIEKPMINGIISDFDAQVSLIRTFISRSVTPYLSQYQFLKPSLEASVAVPSIATEIEQKAIEEVLSKVDGIKFINLTERDVVRHHLVQRIIQAYQSSSQTEGRGQNQDEKTGPSD